MSNLLEIYRNDQFFQKLKETYNKWKNHTDKRRHIAKNEKDVYLLNLLKKFTKIEDIVIDCLSEVNFNRKESFKLWLMIYRKCLKKHSFNIIFKKEYIRKMARIKTRMSFDRSLKELQNKKMLFIYRDNTYFVFEPNLAFLSWDISEDEKESIEKNVAKDIVFYQEIIDNGRIL